MSQRFFYLLFLLLVCAVGCSPFSRQAMDEVQREIRFKHVLEDPGRFVGKTVILGGVIVEAIVKPGDTLIIVRQTELDFQKRPRDLDRSLGRFMIRHSGFMDPAIYGQGRELTVIGNISGQKEGLVGERTYVYPLIQVQHLRLWDMRKAVTSCYDSCGPGPFCQDRHFHPWSPHPWSPYCW
ncbi:Slp family lipoprotein [Desulfonatronovibrio hydrogenovorans]|uniref:Slp family lipoprotein n=1 Tax=Desulfonatronovibrio hydrogenovorans TaxID=53245 RepID=UPI00068FA36D|nr:Slp/YeaY family lipoprotein [Desulfonatronovibrio hydrogenovorans]